MHEVDIVFEKLNEQKQWRNQCFNMIASENTPSKWVEEAYMSDFMHRYAEGTPYNRYYRGTKFIDELEDKANKFFAKKLGSTFADVRPVSGAIANMAVMRALTKPGDVITSLSVSAGAHSSHSKGGVAGLLGLNQVQLKFDVDNWSIDTDLSSEIIRASKPKIAIVGASLILFPLDINGLSDACKEVKCKMIYDAAHVFGLIFSGKFQKPFQEGADLISTSTHKTFPGPQGGLIAGNLTADDWPKIQRGIFPKILSNHHLHRIPALLVAAYEMSEFGDAYSTQILKNAKALGVAMSENGFKVCAEDRGFTESHQIAVDVSEFGGGLPSAIEMELVDVIVNKNLLPFDKISRKTLENPSGIRIGVQEMTRFGMKEDDMQVIADIFKRTLIDNENKTRVKKRVNDFRDCFKEVQFTWRDEE